MIIVYKWDKIVLIITLTINSLNNFISDVKYNIDLFYKMQASPMINVSTLFVSDYNGRIGSGYNDHLTIKNQENRLLIGQQGLLCLIYK